MKIWRNGVLFYLGGMIYTVLELLWRRRSHGSMFVAGGICFVILGKMGEIFSPLSRLFRAVLGAGVITLVELVAGLLVNRNWKIWDYRKMPGNFRGLICPAFTALWIPLAAVAEKLYGILDEWIGNAV